MHGHQHKRRHQVKPLMGNPRVLAKRSGGTTESNATVLTCSPKLMLMGCPCLRLVMQEGSLVLLWHSCGCFLGCPGCHLSLKADPQYESDNRDLHQVVCAPSNDGQDDQVCEDGGPSRCSGTAAMLRTFVVSCRSTGVLRLAEEHSRPPTGQ